MNEIYHYLTLDYLIEGAKITVWLALWGFVGGAILAFVICALRSSQIPPLRWIGTAYVTVFRGTPFLLQLIFIYNALPSIGITLGSYSSAILGITLIEGAYIGETYRGALASVPKGQRLAAQALGMNNGPAYWRIYFPQALRSIAPSLGNRGIAVIKETSVASVVSVNELTLRSQQLVSINLDFFPIFTATAIIYLLLTGSVALVQSHMEKRLSYQRVRTSRTRPLSIRAAQKLGLLRSAGGTTPDANSGLGSASDDAEFVKVEGVSQAYGDIHVLEDASLTVHRGEVLVIMGPSGSGKSTLLRAIDSLEPIKSGRITVGGTVMQTGPTRAGGRFRRAGAKRRKHARVAMVFQDFNLFQHMTLLENVMEGPMVVQGLKPKISRQLAIEALTSVGLEAHIDQIPEQLSGGQQQRGAIARALAMKPDLMLFDEPTSALDHELVGEVLASIRALANLGITMIIVTHEREFARDVADRIALFRTGRIERLGTPGQVFEANLTP